MFEQGQNVFKVETNTKFWAKLYWLLSKI